MRLRCRAGNYRLERGRGDYPDSREASSKVDSGAALRVHEIKQVQIVRNDMGSTRSDCQVHVLAVLRITGHNVVLRHDAYPSSHAEMLRKKGINRLLG